MEDGRIMISVSREEAGVIAGAVRDAARYGDLADRIEVAIAEPEPEGGWKWVAFHDGDIPVLLLGLSLLARENRRGLDSDDDDTVREARLYDDHVARLIGTLKSS